MKKLIVIAILLCTGLYSLAADTKELWQKGNTSYELKQYDSASYYFEQLAALKPHNAEVYYNLGNTYYRLNRIGPAILNYQRALSINPEYKEAKDNMTLAQSRINNHIAPVNDIFFINWWHSLTDPHRATTWAIVSLVLFLLVITFTVLRRFSGYRSYVPVQVPVITTFMCACMLLLAYTAAHNEVVHSIAVVMQNNAPLRTDEQKGKATTLVPEGTTVKIKSEKGDWVEVTLPDGRLGWLQQSLIEKI